MHEMSYEKDNFYEKKYYQFCKMFTKSRQLHFKRDYLPCKIVTLDTLFLTKANWT